jgi:adenylyltransferase/sulfurtransferase
LSYFTILATAGVGTIGIVDFDTIEIHNLHRQILYTEDQVGLSKAETAKATLHKLNL